MITKIIENIQIADQYYRLTLDCNEIAQDAYPGQFVMIKVNQGTDPLLRRPFSIHRLWTGLNARKRNLKGIQILFRVVGRGTAQLASFAKGAEIDIIGPLGKGFRLEKHISFPILVAGGIGIAPLLFLADQLKKKYSLVEPHLFLGGKTANDILCLEDFQKHAFLLQISTEDGSLGAKGLISEKLISCLKKMKYSGKTPEGVLFACGPSALMSKVIEISKKYHLPCQVSLEQRMACGVGACLGCVTEFAKDNNAPRYQRVCAEGPVFELAP